MVEENCKSLLEGISDYIDGTAKDEFCRELERHLTTCENCRIVVDTMKKTVYLYQSTTEPNLPPNVRERLFKSLDMDDFLKLS
jgi:predicted anti-sigma-YlaC factor YlaD